MICVEKGKILTESDEVLGLAMEYLMDPCGSPCMHAFILRAKYTFCWLLYIYVFDHSHAINPHGPQDN